MPPKKQWDDEESDESSSAPSSPPVAPARRVNRFDDEEGEDDDVVESWDVDSEEEREKEKKEAEAKAKAAAAAAAKKKPKSERIAEHKAERARREAEDDDSDNDETPAERRARLRKTEMESDLRLAEDLFGYGSVPATRKGTTAGTAVVIDPADPTKTVDFTKMPLFNPTTKSDFDTLRTTLTPVLADLRKKPHYVLFLQEFVKQLAKDLPSDQIKKVSATLTTLSNEKLKEEKSADKGGKKSKAQKTKTSLVTNRANAIDVGTYEDTFNDDDFM